MVIVRLCRTIEKGMPCKSATVTAAVNPVLYPGLSEQATVRASDGKGSGKEKSEYLPCFQILQPAVYGGKVVHDTASLLLRFRVKSAFI